MSSVLTIKLHNCVLEERQAARGKNVVVVRSLAVLEGLLFTIHGEEDKKNAPMNATRHLSTSILHLLYSLTARCSFASTPFTT